MWSPMKDPSSNQIIPPATTEPVSRKPIQRSRCNLPARYDAQALLELETYQPSSMQLCPGRPMVVIAVAQQEAGQLLASLSQNAHCRLTGTDEIADRLVGLIR